MLINSHVSKIHDYYHLLYNNYSQFIIIMLIAITTNHICILVVIINSTIMSLVKQCLSN